MFQFFLSAFQKVFAQMWQVVIFVCKEVSLQKRKFAPVQWIMKGNSLAKSLDSEHLEIVQPFSSSNMLISHVCVGKLEIFGIGVF